MHTLYSKNSIMALISGYSTVQINGFARKIATVKNGNIFYIWFEDVRDVNTYKTTGYVIQKGENKPATIMPVNEGGILPNDVDQMLKQIIETKPDWQRQTPDVV